MKVFCSVLLSSVTEMVAVGEALRIGTPGGIKLKPNTRGMISTSNSKAGTSVAAVTDSAKRLFLTLIELFARWLIRCIPLETG
jgi:hypothetical protein